MRWLRRSLRRRGQSGARRYLTALVASLCLSQLAARMGLAEVAKVAEPQPSAPVVAAKVPVKFDWGSGLEAHSGDGASTLQIRARLQVQAIAQRTSSDEASNSTIDLMARRMRIVIRSQLLTPHIEYYVQLGIAPRDMEGNLLIPLRDAQIAWTGLRDLAIRAGIMKVPFSRERVISSSALQLVDRSIVNAELSLDRDNGLQLYSNDLFGLGGYLGYQLGVFVGDGRLRTNQDMGLLYVARAQVQPFGRFDDQLTQVDFTREKRARLSIGTGFGYNDGTRRQRSTTGDSYLLGSFNYRHIEADLIFKYAGFSLQSEFLYRHAGYPSMRDGLINDKLVTEIARNAAGWFAQAGYLFGVAPVEIAGRIAEVYPLGATTSATRQREMTVGLNWYPKRHDLKLQLDASQIRDDLIAKDSTPAPTDRYQVRIQAQTYF